MSDVRDLLRRTADLAADFLEGLRGLAFPGPHTGVAELIDRCCECARRFAAGLAEIPGAELLNDVVNGDAEIELARERFAAAAQEPAHAPAR